MRILYGFSPVHGTLYRIVMDLEFKNGTGVILPVRICAWCSELVDGQVGMSRQR